jgi:hypothetical protein
MARYTHRFVEEYEGLVGFGLDHETDGHTVTCYLQMFSDDRLMKVLRDRMTPQDLEDVFNLLAGLLKKHLTEEEYHAYFLRDGEDEP